MTACANVFLLVSGEGSLPHQGSTVIFPCRWACCGGKVNLVVFVDVCGGKV